MESDGRALPRSESKRTLLDIIREEGGGSKENKKSWKSFKSKLDRKNSGGRGSTWTSTVPVPASDIPLSSSSGKKTMARQPSSRINSGSNSDSTAEPDIHAVPNSLRRSSLVRKSPSGRMDLQKGPTPMRRLQREFNSDENDEDDEGGEEEEEEETGGMDGAGAGEERPVRMSLMSLLGESDKDGFAYGMDDEQEDDDDDDDDEYGSGGGGGGDYNNCCVCMVRHKGTAFVPCGHTFCRLCSRELCVQGGNCPLCNNYILEILDIF